MEVFLEILKFTIPSFAVVVTVYLMMRVYFDSQHKKEMLEFRSKQQNATLPLRLGAYERLSLFCERISIPAVILRVCTEGTTSAQLRIALLLAVQQEFEHNITQQVYVSDKLWQIVKIARDDVQNTINFVYQSVDPQSDSKEFARALYNHLEQKEVLPLHKALEAVKKEAGLLM